MEPWVFVDPTLLATQRGRVWVARAVGRGLGAAVAVPESCFNGHDDATYTRRGGPFARRSVQDVWRGEKPNVRYIAASDDGFSRFLARDGYVAAAEAWTALQAGAVVAARRTPLLDQWVASGLELHVSSPARQRACDWRLVVPDEDVAEALLRRVRFIVRSFTPTRGEQPHVDVMDLGAEVPR
jgi:hypothetical protein